MFENSSIHTEINVFQGVKGFWKRRNGQRSDTGTDQFPSQHQ